MDPALGSAVYAGFAAAAVFLAPAAGTRRAAPARVTVEG